MSLISHTVVDDSSASSAESGVTVALAAPLGDTASPALDAANPVHFNMLTRLQQLEESLLARDPMMKIHLGAIHKELIQYDELVHLLSNEQIGKIVEAQQLHTNVSLVAELTSKSGKAKAAGRSGKITLADL